MLASLVLAAAGFAVLGLSLSFTANVVAFAAVGFGLAILCPCLFNMAASQVLANRAAGLSFAGLIAGPPRILAPWVFGWVATSQSTSFAFGLCAALMVVVLVSGGVQLVVAGLLGEYLWRTLEEVRPRPPFVVARALPPLPRGD